MTLELGLGLGVVVVIFDEIFNYCITTTRKHSQYHLTLLDYVLLWPSGLRHRSVFRLVRVTGV